MQASLTSAAHKALGITRTRISDAEHQKTLAHRAASRRERLLDVPDVRQKYSNWCWAALASSLAEHFLKMKIPPCSVAHAWLHHPDCDDDPHLGAKVDVCEWETTNNYRSTKDAANQPQVFDRPLELAQDARRIDLLRRKPALRVIRDQVNIDSPVGILIRWESVDGTKEGGHFVAVIGYSSDKDKLMIQDPNMGRMDISYDTFPSSYFTVKKLVIKSRWEITYWTGDRIRRTPT